MSRITRSKETLFNLTLVKPVNTSQLLVTAQFPGSAGHVPRIIMTAKHRLASEQSGKRTQFEVAHYSLRHMSSLWAEMPGGLECSDWFCGKSLPACGRWVKAWLISYGYTSGPPWPSWLQGDGGCWLTWLTADIIGGPPVSHLPSRNENDT